MFQPLVSHGQELTSDGAIGNAARCHQLEMATCLQSLSAHSSAHSSLGTPGDSCKPHCLFIPLRISLSLRQSGQATTADQPRHLYSLLLVVVQLGEAGPSPAIATSHSLIPSTRYSPAMPFIITSFTSFGIIITIQRGHYYFASRISGASPALKAGTEYHQSCNVYQNRWQPTISSHHLWH
jgi:hypothetical protein